MNLKPLSPGEVAAQADGEGFRDRRPLAVQIGGRREQAPALRYKVISITQTKLSCLQYITYFYVKHKKKNGTVIYNQAVLLYT